MSKFLYIITDGEFQKIGIASNPAKRIKQLQTGNARRLSVLKLYKHDKSADLEVALHLLMDSGRQVGEWFSMTDNELIGIERLLSIFGIKPYVGKEKTHVRTATVIVGSPNDVEQAETAAAVIEDALNKGKIKRVSFPQCKTLLKGSGLTARMQQEIIDNALSALQKKGVVAINPEYDPSAPRSGRAKYLVTA